MRLVIRIHQQIFKDIHSSIYIITNSPWSLRKNLNRLRKKPCFKGNEYKFSRDSREIKVKVLAKIRDADIDIEVVAIVKPNVKETPHTPIIL